MAQPKAKSRGKQRAHMKHEPSNSLSSTTTDGQKQYFNRSSMTNVNRLHNKNGTKASNGNNSGMNNKNGKTTKMAGLKKWFSRLGNNKGNVDASEKSAHSQIEKRIAQQSKLEMSTINMLLLGAGGSGKSTVLKQMEKIHGAGKYKNSDDEKGGGGNHGNNGIHSTINEVHKNIIMDIYDLVKHYFKLKQNDESIAFESSDIENVAIKIQQTHDPIHHNKLTPQFANDIEKLWNTQTMKKVYDIRKKSHIMDNTPYFLNNVKQYADPNCIPSFEDYVRIRDQTTGIINSEFTVQDRSKKWLFKITDVGGQRAERRKWLQVFSGIDVVLYVMSLSAYDHVLYEDHNTRCWDETLGLFEKTVSNKSFKETDFIVFLNKNDIFQEKILTVPFTVYLEDFPSEQANNPQTVQNWLKNQFSARFYSPSSKSNSNNHRGNGYTINYNNSNNSNGGTEEEEEEKYDATKQPMNNGMLLDPMGKKRGLHFHITCATDTEQIATVVKCVQIELIRKLMSKAGLM